jgi:hypothetical protein
MPTGIAYRDGALYVADIDKIYKYDNPEADPEKLPEPQVVYDDMPPYPPHGWKYLAFDKDGWLYVPFGPPCNICLPPTSVSQIRRVNPANGLAEIVALGVCNNVGGDVDPRTGDYWFSENARDWLGDDVPSDKLNHITKIGEQAWGARRTARDEVLYRRSIPGRLQEQHHIDRAWLLEPSPIPGWAADAGDCRPGRQKCQTSRVRHRLDRR